MEDESDDERENGTRRLVLTVESYWAEEHRNFPMAEVDGHRELASAHS
jgi:hypothetical protein